MTPIDLPPEPSFSQPPLISIGTVALAKQTSGASLLSDFQAAPTRTSSTPSTDSHWEITAAPNSLIPFGQLSETSSADFSKPNLTQLPTLPPLTGTGSDLPSEEALDTVNQVIDAELDAGALETIEPTDLDKLEPQFETDNLSPEAINEAIDDVDPNAIDLDGVNTDALDTDALDPGSVPDVLDDVLDRDLDGVTPENAPENAPENVPGNIQEEPDPAAIPPAAGDLPPLDLSKLEITSDTQSFDAIRQVVTARGNAVFKLNNAFLLADEMWINLNNRYVLAEGNVILTRGEQEVRGERAEYNLLQESGTLFETRGELFLPGFEDDFASPVDGAVTSRTVFDPLNPDGDITNVTSAGGLQFSSSIRGNAPGSLPQAEGGVTRLRFEAARVQFDSEAWIAEEVRLTNDPFSPPELEFRTNRLTLVTLSPTADLLTTENPRLVFDQGFALPLVKSQYILNRGAVDSNQVNPFLVNIGSDSRERGGIFLESEFPLIRNESTNFSITPQYFLERALSQGALSSDVLGIEMDFSTRLSQRSDISANATLTGLDFDNIEDNLRGNIRNRWLVGNHLLATEYSYRDRLFNGSLGFQTVRSSLGAVLISPVINLDQRGLNLTYQVGGQWITADTDRLDLLDPFPRDNNRISLGRLQASARLGKGFTLWVGKPLPATQTEGLRYTPSPLVPFLSLGVSLLGVGSYYTSGDFQEELVADVRLDGQIGHLSKNFFDYTRFNLGYSHDLISSNNSPFLFDRNVDNRVLTFGILQQIFGPILLGFQTSINIANGEDVNTEIIAEYSRRTYGLVVRYSPTRSTGSIGFRLSNFNWLGSGSPFDEPNIRQVDSGVIEQR
ncbi:DUF3769 domain-containing protein [Leptothoe sp. PORK10 BA2]|uniref:DUF3769 domain-containing protein n=1 Tax=Leptothoe sp. PORK10 BA2 TaxID=3110254 RepID=UPI002B1F30AD|nr:DUF3769 domain-containing protein [Leptothoe sp. PORK10 BA2]MEA5462968.1 DUF3769 domain-containing protein [Leptothoe sp. PORK10 BA2]